MHKEGLIKKKMQEANATPRPKKSERINTPDFTEEKNL
jgi:hypothetical protein